MNNTQKAGTYINHSGVARPAMSFADEMVAEANKLIDSGVVLDDALLHDVAKLTRLEGNFNPTALKNRTNGIERGL